MSPRKPTRAVQLGVTDDDYARMLEQQDGHCALCPSTPKARRFSVDHDHATGAVRGLLCHRCNRALPTWITPAWLHRAAAYLEPPPVGTCGSRNPHDPHEWRTLLPSSHMVRGVVLCPGVAAHGNAATTGNNRTGLTTEGVGE